MARLPNPHNIIPAVPASKTPNKPTADPRSVSGGNPAAKYDASETGASWATHTRATLADLNRFKGELQRWNTNAPADKSRQATQVEADRFYQMATKHQESLRQCREQHTVLGLKGDSSLLKELDDALLELQVVLKFPPATLRETQGRIRAVKWKTLADAKNELGHHDR